MYDSTVLQTKHLPVYCLKPDAMQYVEAIPQSPPPHLLSVGLLRNAKKIYVCNNAIERVTVLKRTLVTNALFDSLLVNLVFAGATLTLYF